MDFFAAQERARQRTKRLVFLFVLAVLGTIAAGYAASWLILQQLDGRQGYTRDRYGRRVYYAASSESRPLLDPKLLLLVTGGTVTVVGLASLFKWSQMRDGGSAIAEMVGGRALDLKTTDLRERKLLNVVEEMSIASGIPMPAVYVLEEEPGINAFAAGLTTSDAAVAVSRGALDKLTRDELQGVIGHEFSHILNGDMRLNVRITAVVFGILVIGLLGRGMVETLSRGRIRSGGDKKDGGVVIFLAIGVALLIIGYVGYFFGRLIQAAVSRQREFLADASAVQFTRNPTGITGALKKIGGYAIGGNMINSHAGEIGHLFFAQAFESNFGGLWATHPPLGERIRAVDPTWDGKLFEPETLVDITTASSATAGFGGGTRYPASETLQRVHDAQPNLPPPRVIAPVAFKPAAVVSDIGALTESHFRHAQLLLDSSPASLREATRDPLSAQVLVYGLLLGSDRTARDQQQGVAHVVRGGNPALYLRPDAELLECRLAVEAGRHVGGVAHGEPAAAELRVELGAGLQIDVARGRGRCDEHQFVDEQVATRARVDQIVFLRVVHPVLVGRDEDVGRCTFLDLACERRTRAVHEHRLLAGFPGVGGGQIVEGVFHAGGGEHLLRGGVAGKQQARADGGHGERATQHGGRRVELEACDNDSFHERGLRRGMAQPATRGRCRPMPAPGCVRRQGRSAGPI